MRSATFTSRSPQPLPLVAPTAIWALVDNNSISVICCDADARVSPQLLGDPGAATGDTAVGCSAKAAVATWCLVPAYRNRARRSNHPQPVMIDHPAKCQSP